MRKDVFGESVPGALHDKHNKPCQDSRAMLCMDNGTVILSVADGHGSESCPYSQDGSKIATAVFINVLKEHIQKYGKETDTLITYLNREGDTRVAQLIDAKWKNSVVKLHKEKERVVPFGADGQEDKMAICQMYGSTLLGLVIAEEFVFAFQLGDGDIMRVTSDHVEHVIQADKFLGTETHSISKINSWKNAVTKIMPGIVERDFPILYSLTSDGFFNSFVDEDQFEKTCRDYFDVFIENGAQAVKENLADWLKETSLYGCGDDITYLCAFYRKDDRIEKKSFLNFFM